jgi:hypothetical protein
LPHSRIKQLETKRLRRRARPRGQGRDGVVEVSVDDRVDPAQFFSIRLALVDAAVAKSDRIDDQLFREGGKVCIKMGYAGRPLRTMIEGEITAVQPHFSSRGP